MEDTAMSSLNPTLEEEIAAVNRDIVSLTKRYEFSKTFKRLYDTEEFQEVFMETILGSEVKAKAESLALNPHMDTEQEQDTLAVLRSMRYLNKLIGDKLWDVENVGRELKLSTDYLHQLMAEHED